MFTNFNSNYFFKKVFIALFVISILGASSCKKDPIIENEEELITSLIYRLVPRDGSSTIEFKFTDSDGDGPGRPIVTTGQLKANTIYDGTIKVLNELVNPVTDITTEVSEEAIDHQFFYVVKPTNLLSVTYNDLDSSGLPLGVSTVLTTGVSATGTLDIILRHKPIKTATGVSSGNIDNAGGETDIEVSFPVVF